MKKSLLLMTVFMLCVSTSASHADDTAWLINSSVVDSPYKTLLNLKSYVETQ